MTPAAVERMALTGGIATGKSHVRQIFERLGIPCIDADRLARQAVAPGTAGLEAVTARFGRDILTKTGELDRRALGARVFADPVARRDLEAIVHPAVRQATDAWFAALDPERHPRALAEIPLLYETGRERDFSTVIVAACAPDEQLRRIIARDDVSAAEAQQRIAAQLPLAEKIRRADYVIHTDGSYADTERRTREVFDRLVAGSGFRRR